VLWAGLSETLTLLYEINRFCRNEAGVFPAPDISVSPEIAIICLPGTEPYLTPYLGSCKAALTEGLANVLCQYLFGAERSSKWIGRGSSVSAK
jgi:hypothetical protein